MQAAIETDQLRKCFGSLVAVDNLNLTIPTGQFFGLLGSNGSGKTTILHMLATLVHPSSGWARVSGYLTHIKPVEVRRSIGVVFQESALDRNLTVKENMELAGALYNLPKRTIDQRSREMLNLFGLENTAEKPVYTLSGGMRRAIDIIRGVLHQPHILLLDEPTLGLDPINRRNIWDFLQLLRNKEKITVMLITHYLEEALPCEHVLFMHQGKVIGSGDTQSLLNTLGNYILEIMGPDLTVFDDAFNASIGPSLQDGNKRLFRIFDKDFSLDSTKLDFRHEINRLLVRQPNLNDVYLWQINEFKMHEYGSFTNSEETKCGVL